MSASNLSQEIQQLPADQPLDWPAFSQRLNEEFTAAVSSEERSDLLAVRASAIDLVIRQFELFGDHLEKFLDVCELDYKKLIVQETLDGATVSYDKMLHVTDREISAGRMSDDYALRAIALEEFPGHEEVAQRKPDDAHSRSTRLARLKRWLHIE